MILPQLINVLVQLDFNFLFTCIHLLAEHVSHSSNVLHKTVNHKIVLIPGKVLVWTELPNSHLEAQSPAVSLTQQSPTVDPDSVVSYIKTLPSCLFLKLKCS